MLSLAVFYFVFLGTEYLFDNMMMNLVDSDGVVLVQNYILGASVLGFVLFPFINRYLKGYLEYVAGIVASIIAAVSVAVTYIFLFFIFMSFLLKLLHVLFFFFTLFLFLIDVPPFFRRPSPADPAVSAHGLLYFI